MEDLVRNPAPAFWRNRRVLLTGHTGFKGAWTALWLEALGADVHGLSLPPQSSPNLFDLAAVSRGCTNHMVDLRDAAAVAHVVAKAQPQIALHMAAQALVRRSLADPLTTYQTNVLGTVHLLDALRSARDLEAILVVTSDKVYANSTARRAYSEDDPLGGSDPYSSSKAACEMVARSFAACYFRDRVPLATARGGNVIGGGDFAEDRIVPDCVRAVLAGEPVILRHPDAIRPWQHVLDCVAGYLIFAEHLATNPDAPPSLNFGPDSAVATSVKDLAQIMMSALGAPGRVVVDSAVGSLEKEYLAIDAARARRILGWRDRMRGEAAIEATAAWYVQWRAGNEMRHRTIGEIERYQTGREAAA